ncbi:MAG TPA: hypothetical protein VHQ22_12295 [Terriglobales bacterium]|jgi:hypothetical protein|nr:hypothetical protein [Terriglobales bacterium]
MPLLEAPTLLLAADLRVQTSVSLEEILDLLNGSKEAAIASPLWTGDGFYETNCAAVKPGLDIQKFCQSQRAEREIALEKVRLSIDEWIDSGKRGSQEAANWRTVEQAPEAASESTAYWETSRIIFDRRDTTAYPILVPHDENNFENASWKARRIIALILSSDLRLRIAKCRYEKCKRPYFLLHKLNKVYRHGTFCCVDHNRSATAPKRMHDRRYQFQSKLIDWAVSYVCTNGVGEWQANIAFKEKLARHLATLIAKQKAPARDSITKNWVTRNSAEIQAKFTSLMRR